MAHMLTIGGLAKAAGVNVETIRYYQRRGLIREPPKPSGSQRRYPESIVRELAFVRRGQEFGFTLAEIKDLQGFSGVADRQDVRRIAQFRHTRLVLHARQLALTSAKLKSLLERSRRYRGAGPDPIIVALRDSKAGTR